MTSEQLRNARKRIDEAFFKKEYAYLNAQIHWCDQEEFSGIRTKTRTAAQQLIDFTKDVKNEEPLKFTD